MVFMKELEKIWWFFGMFFEKNENHGYIQKNGYWKILKISG
jgi:hypothetical protein